MGDVPIKTLQKSRQKSKNEDEIKSNAGEARTLVFSLSGDKTLYLPYRSQKAPG
jgi:hypothetical protein